MKTLKHGLRHMSVPVKIQKARTIVSRMDGNTYFSSPNPPLADVTAAATALENAYEEAQDGSRTKRLLLRQCESTLDGLIKTLGAYVQSASAGDEAVIVSSGFEARRGTTTPVPAANPSGVRGKATIHAGEVAIRWNGASSARSYIAEMSVDGIAWIKCGVATKTRMIVQGLLSGSKPYFRIAAIGPLGQSGWSDPGAVRVD